MNRNYQKRYRKWIILMNHGESSFKMTVFQYNFNIFLNYINILNIK